MHRCRLNTVNGNPAIAYEDFTNGDLKFIRATNANGTAWSAPQTLDSNGGSATSLIIVGGNPAIAYSTTTLHYIRATNASGTAWGAPVTVASNNALDTSMVVAGGKPAIAYYALGKLNYVQAADANGAAWNTPMILDQTSTDTGSLCSLVLDDSSLPTVAYYDTVNKDLMYVASFNFGDDWGAPQVLASIGNVGLFCSQALVDSSPAVCYEDSDHISLRYMRLF